MRVSNSKAVVLRIALVIILAFSAMCLLSCRPESDKAASPSGDNGDTQAHVYRHAMDGAPTSLDPIHASSIYANFLVVNFYDTLYR